MFFFWNQEVKSLFPQHLLHNKKQEQISACLSELFDITVAQTIKKLESLNRT